MSVADRAPAPRATLSWWRRRSLRARLTAAAAAVIAVGMVAAAVLLVFRVHSVLVANLDATLTRQIDTVAEDVTAGDTTPRLPRSAGESTALQVIDAGGKVVTSSGDIDGEPRVFFVSPGAADPTFATVTPPALDASYRVAALTVKSPSGPVTVYVASPTTPLASSTTELGTALILGVPTMVVLLALVGWWLLGRALQPVDTMRRQAAAIPGTDLQRRLEIPASHDELARLAETFNDLLGRIETASERQRRFVADAAHELRNPLAALRARLEIDLRHAGPTGTNPSPTQDQALQQVIRLAELVNDLLQLASLDANPNLHRRPVDLDDVVWEAALEAREQAPPRIDTTGISPVRVLGDSAALRRVVRNLLGNARRHARQTVTVRLSIDTPPASGTGPPTDAAPTATLTVADDGPGIPAADRHRVFQRFVRLDEARTRDAGGAGLGLAIVADIVAAHGGRVWIDDNHPGARFHVRLATLPPGQPDFGGRGGSGRLNL
jgi:signal transduction histidine kinase